MRRVFAVVIAMTTLALGVVGGTAAPANATTPPCWTTFNPPAPQGGELYQTYRNCNGYNVAVMPYYVDSSGADHIFQVDCVYVPNNAWYTWHYGFTEHNVNYGTAFCRPPYPPSTKTAFLSSSGRCWNYFSPSAPNGAPMTQDYYDCNYNLGEVMAPAYKTSNGALYGYETGCVKQDEESPEPFVNGFEWYFPSTNHNVNYLTVYCETSTQG